MTTNAGGEPLIDVEAVLGDAEGPGHLVPAEAIDDALGADDPVQALLDGGWL